MGIDVDSMVDWVGEKAMTGSKPPSPVRVGMRADELRKMRGRGPWHLVSAPEWDKFGRSCKWHYADCTVVLQREGYAPYRVAEVLEEGDGDAVSAAD